MRITAETLQLKISELKKRLAECSYSGDILEEVKEILRTAPMVLQEAEGAILLNNSLTFLRVHKLLNNIEKAVGECLQNWWGIDLNGRAEQTVGVMTSPFIN